MIVERQNVSEKTFGSLGGCLVECDPEQRARERRIRRRALTMSIVLQGAALAALVLIPLFGKTESIVFAYVTPIPPYYHPRSPAQSNTPTAPTRPTTTFNFCTTCPVPSAHPRRPTSTVDQLQPPGVLVIEGDPNSTAYCPGCIPIAGRQGPTPPPPPATSQPTRLIMTHLDPALLIHRVEPVYPTLARQTGRSGRVELRAIVATDGTIQSLQVVSGDPLFFQSALDGVRQWRYRPTILNGKPMEIDTFITVIYNINR